MPIGIATCADATQPEGPSRPGITPPSISPLFKLRIPIPLLLSSSFQSASSLYLGVLTVETQSYSPSAGFYPTLPINNGLSNGRVLFEIILRLVRSEKRDSHFDIGSGMASRVSTKAGPGAYSSMQRLGQCRKDHFAISSKGALILCQIPSYRP